MTQTSVSSDSTSAQLGSLHPANRASGVVLEQRVLNVVVSSIYSLVVPSEGAANQFSHCSFVTSDGDVVPFKQSVLHRQTALVAAAQVDRKPEVGECSVPYCLK